MLCVHFGVLRHEDPLWVRITSSVAAFVPAHMWLLKRVYVVGGMDPFRYCGRELARWVVPAFLLAGLCWTNWYVLPRPAGVDAPAHFGPAYLLYMLGEFALFGLLCRETIVQLRRLTGVSRLELQILLLGVCAAAFAIIFLMGLRIAAKAIWPIQWQPIMLLLVYSATLVAVTTHRIFDARQIALVALQKLALIATAGAAAFFIERVMRAFSAPEPLPLLCAVSATFGAVRVLDRILRSHFHYYPEATAAREAVFAATRSETKWDRLEASFRTILKGWGQAENATVIYVNRNSLLNDAVSDDGVGLFRVMQQLQWATPERLTRERTNAERQRIADYLERNRFGVLVVSEGPTFLFVVAVGVSASRLPYTYPQVVQLLELASIMESALERVHFSNKAQHAEQLATVGLLGASVAHEIRNPLVTIKSFVQLLPAHYQDERFRGKFFKLIADEVNRIDRLTEQLLDLASPRTYSATSLELHPILRACVELIATRAAHKDVEIVSEFVAAPDVVHTDPAAAKQVILNLCFNAIQALEGKEDGARRMWIKTANAGSTLEVIIADNGPGIAPEVMPRLFQPFQTTKSTGFGLGLAICSDILTNLNASISVDSPVAGAGATFRVNFPCQSSSS